MKALVAEIGAIIFLVGSFLNTQVSSTQAIVQFQVELEPSGDNEYSPTSFSLFALADSLCPGQLHIRI